MARKVDWDKEETDHLPPSDPEKPYPTWVKSKTLRVYPDGTPYEGKSRFQQTGIPDPELPSKLYHARRCTHIIHSTGVRCRQGAMANSTKCVVHNRSFWKGGPMHPGTIHGRYSQALPADLLPKYEFALRDPDLIALRDELALLDSRLSSLLQSIDVGSTHALWQSLAAVSTRLRLAIDAASPDATAKAADQLAQIISSGSSTTTTWAEIYDILELRRRLAETERRRLIDLNTTITTEKALALVAALAASIRKHVTDASAIAAISSDFADLLNASPDLSTRISQTGKHSLPPVLDPAVDPPPTQYAEVIPREPSPISTLAASAFDDTTDDTDTDTDE